MSFRPLENSLHALCIPIVLQHDISYNPTSIIMALNSDRDMALPERALRVIVPVVNQVSDKHFGWGDSGRPDGLGEDNLRLAILQAYGKDAMGRALIDTLYDTPAPFFEELGLHMPPTPIPEYVLKTALQDESVRFDREALNALTSLSLGQTIPFTRADQVPASPPHVQELSAKYTKALIEGLVYSKTNMNGLSRGAHRVLFDSGLASEDPRDRIAGLPHWRVPFSARFAAICTNIFVSRALRQLHDLHPTFFVSAADMVDRGTALLTWGRPPAQLFTTDEQYRQYAERQRWFFNPNSLRQAPAPTPSQVAGRGLRGSKRSH